MTDDLQRLERQLDVARENLALIEERISDYVLSTGVPLDLIREQRRLQKKIPQLERRIANLRPITVLRRATKLLVGPVAATLTGEPWKNARQRLLTQASKLPRADHLDEALMDAAVDDLQRLIHELRVLLEAGRIEPNPGQLEALERRAAPLAGHLIRIYRLEAGELRELDALAAAEL